MFHKPRHGKCKMTAAKIYVNEFLNCVLEKEIKIDSILAAFPRH